MVPTGYAAAYTTDANGNRIITNTHTPATTSVTVNKVWADNNNQDGLRPVSVSVQLKADGAAVGTPQTLTGAGWTYTWNNLPKNSGGALITYTVEETVVPTGYAAAYTTDANGNRIITNTHTPATTSVTVNKVWADNNNQDGLRPVSVSVQLKADGAAVGTPQTLTGAGWTYTWNNLPKNSGGALITYTVEETVVPTGYAAAYTTDANGNRIITNTHTPATTSVTVNKVWADNNNQDGLRPVSVSVQLKADGAAVGTPQTLTGAGWTYTWNNLPKNSGGALITYTVEETVVPTGYAAAYTTDANGNRIITNTHTPATTSVTVNKVWADNNNQDGLRPVSVSVQLKADGAAVGTPQTLTGAGWTYTWNNLPKNSGGALITYTVEETVVPTGYAAAYTTDANGNRIITNTHTPATTSVTVSKVWADNNNQDGLRPVSVSVQLKADGAAVGTPQTLTGAGWTYTWNNLPKNSGGALITYTVEETVVPTGYAAAYTTDANGNRIITNTHTPATTSVTVNKVWADNNNQDGLRPVSVSVQLKADGAAVGTPQTLTGAGWTYTWNNLPKNSGGALITYTVEETVVPTGYAAAYTTDANGNRIITNTHTPELTSATVIKSWNDNNNQDGLRTEVSAQLKADGQNYGLAQPLNEGNGWTYTWNSLPKYAGSTTAVVYTVVEVAVPTGYTEAYSTDDNGNMIITNTHTPATTVVSGSKTWNMIDNEIMPDLTINLFSKLSTDPAYPAVPLASIILDGIPDLLGEDAAWVYAFRNLPMYAGGVLIDYKVEEVVPAAYTMTSDGNNFTNTAKETSVTGTKTWNLVLGETVPSIQINLFRNNAPTIIYKSIVLDGVIDANGEIASWQYQFAGLPTNDEDGVFYVYSVKEVLPAGYLASSETSEDGFNFTNTQLTTEVTGSKTWTLVDGEADPTITVNLYRDDNPNVVYKSTTVTGSDTYTFSDLPQTTATGTAITYKVKEVLPAGYLASSNQDGNEFYNTQLTTQVTGSKTWTLVDGEADPTITINLYRDDQVGVYKSTTVTGSDTYTFADLPQTTATGAAITYKVEEVLPAGYLASSNQDGNEFYNTQLTTEVTGSKTWTLVDGEADPTITINLYRDDNPNVVYKSTTVTGSGNYTFSDLPQTTATGTAITYSVMEVLPAGYLADQSGR